MRSVYCALLLLILSLVASCGADKLKVGATNSMSGMSAQSCACNTSGPPVCSAGKEYLNSCLASCYGALEIKVGHCQCEGHIVCGSDGQNHNECAARNDLGLSIVKYIPCEAQEM